MEKEKCRLCGNRLEFVFSHFVLEKYKVNYFLCDTCELLQTEQPYWLDEAYASAIDAADTGIMLRNINLCKIASVIIYFLFEREGKFIDYGGGHGIYTRLMRDVGFDYYWFDKYAKNLFARRNEAVKSKIYAGATAFEVFEHLDDPIKTMEDIFSYLEKKTVLFTTQLYGDRVPDPAAWWYYAFNTGQHISFYNIKTLHWIAENYNLNLWSNGCSMHCFTEEKISDWKFNILNKFNKYIFSYVNRSMSSRTMSDHQILLKNTGM
ncbi:methyltransferase type 11 [Desulfofarcimen acetoxidans DSM 771]|uniref:Methyltransferase type 11 n=1 Tax=Desulfofarcimen acetoxidans (strain ATCC 49208 / DSM 771 / KCTC 5769 / VKM B-1644 / 5575) TaxID=485916 RepID=C8W1Y5_DESAS|nr:class I SAM-dependent methyltransferase [Desulfofarcimen acetoxidans]ACV63606.1 methyltransferase type 11 [Desulfofarcimen acetoxidans DSM 771]